MPEKRSWLLMAATAAVIASAVSAQTEIASGDPPEPRINAPRVVGTTPGKPFLFRLPATGEGPLRFSAQDLPEGLVLDPASGIITGSVKADGTYVAAVTVAGARGSVTRNLVLKAGKNQLALTPPLGWNSWNVWGLQVNQERVKRAAEAMVASGLAAHGFSYVNIDDGWEKGHAVVDVPGINLLLLQFLIPDRDAGRAPDGRIRTNRRFPDLKALADYLHSRGLKFGIYSSPGPWTCGGYEGSWGHEQQDAQTWADWGVDYLKYDFCSYPATFPGSTFKFRLEQNLRLRDFLDLVPGSTLEDYQRPYREMAGYLASVNRDLVFSVCNGGVRKVWEWGREVGGNLWRTTIDIQDNWESISRIGFQQPELAKFGGPGHWNDPDMLVVGVVGWGPLHHYTRLTRPEQVTHITIWAMEAAPLLLGCDLTKLDQFTIDLLTNDEVLEVDQDPLGIAATVKARAERSEVWARPLWDGTQAVSLFNRSEVERELSVNWPELGLSGPQPVRNLWLRKDLGEHDGSITVSVPKHGAVMLKIGRPAAEDYAP